MPGESTPANREEALNRLKELVLDHLGIPRPKQSAHIQMLQDELLPAFMDLARHAWLASSPLPLNVGVLSNESTHPVYQYLQTATVTHREEIRKLNSILDNLGVHALFNDVANSPDIAMVGDLPVDPYDDRLLREAGHRTPNVAIREFLRYASKNPNVLADSEAELERAWKAMLRANGDINVIINSNVSTQQSPKPAVKNDPVIGDAVAAAKPKRLRLFSGLSKLASGLVLLSGNAIVIPTVTIGSLTALPVLGSLAAGIAAVGEGVSYFLREGE